MENMDSDYILPPRPSYSNKRKTYSNSLINRNELQYYPSSYDIDPIWDFKVENDEDNKDLKKERIYPEEEFIKFKEVSRLRRVYEALCFQYSLKSPPGDSFNRWLFAQLTTPSKDKKDSLLANPDLANDCRVLRYEIQRNLPSERYIKFTIREDPIALRQFIHNYHACVIRWMDKVIQRHLEVPTNFIDVYTNVLDCIERSKVIVKQLVSNANELYSHFEQLTDSIFNLLEETTLLLTDPIMNTLCHETYIAIENIKKVTMSEEKKKNNGRVTLNRNHQEIWKINYNDKDSLSISKTHYKKLYTLYSIHNPKDTNHDLFLDCLYVLLRRYYTFFGNLRGDSMHAAALPRVFQYLKKEFDVKQENFASPLNCYFKKFNSAFPDIDVFFGSLGSFFDFKPMKGSFETGPPYTEEVMFQMAKHIDFLLNRSNQALSFIVFVPDWRTPISPGIALMENSIFNRADFVIEGKKYNYVIGQQHSEEVKKRYWTIPFDTHIYIMQNDEGNKKWVPTTTFIEGFKKKLYQ